MHLADYQTYVPDSANQEKTIAITKDTNARDTANIDHKLGELTSGSMVKVDTQQQPYKAKINGKFYKYYRGTVVSKAADSTESIAVGASVYLYANCFPAGTFSTLEKPKLPSYWKATVTGKSKEPMAVYSSEQTCKERTELASAVLNPEQTVTFNSEQIKQATIKGKRLKIAPCQFPQSSTFRKTPEPQLKDGWMIVDESQVSWEKIEPTDFDHIVKLSEPLPISAGDPVGFMGIWESPEDPIAAGTTKTKYQMHVELFTANDKAALDQFLKNDAKLTSGKKYLKVPKGTQLYASNGHGNYVYVHDSLFAARDYVFAENDCTQVKDIAGTIFYQLKQIRTSEAALGPVDLYYVKIEGNVKLVTQYDWKALGFSTLEETNDDADGYINPEKIPSDLFKDIFKRVDGINSRNGQGDGNLTGKEIQDALQQDKDLRNDLYKIIAGHPSEWHSTTQNNIKKMYEMIKAENTEEEYKNATQFEIDRFLKCEFVSQIDGLTQKLWHFHPVLFSFYIKNIEYWPLGKTSESFESGGRGPGVVSTGNGDFGGVSYGVYQLSTNMGRVQQYVSQSKYKGRFFNLDAGSNEFTKEWKKIAEEHPVDFRKEQHQFIKTADFDVQMSKLKDNNIDFNHNRAAINDMVWSTTVQFGRDTKVIIKALKDKNINALKDSEIIELVQNYKIENNQRLFSSSPSLWSGLLDRAKSEKAKLIELEKKNYLINIDGDAYE